MTLKITENGLEKYILKAVHVGNISGYLCYADKTGFYLGSLSKKVKKMLETGDKIRIDSIWYQIDLE